MEVFEEALFRVRGGSKEKDGRSQGQSASALFFDLDHSKRRNDRYGQDHACGGVEKWLI
jgi:GGDEF domain-containing protein